MAAINPRTKKPYQQNDLFRGDAGNWHLNACVGYNGGPYDFRDYADGYIRSGLSLASAAKRHEAPVDILVYPIAYCFRHGIELYLKHLCELLPKLWSEESVPIATHKLLDNWGKVRSYLEREPLFNKQGAEVIQAEKIIRDFVQIDPNGEIFRFPVSRKGDYHLGETSLVNVEVLRDAMAEVLDLFEGWHYVAEGIYECQLQHRG